jgi:hypothetical protein
MARNGERHPPRPDIRLVTAAGSETEAAAVVAAVEQFLADTALAPAPAPEGGSESRWLRAALDEGVSHTPSLAWGPRTG